MSDPDLAGLDPIFWLHHANIDRLWQVWRENRATDVDPTDPNWLNGPDAVGERAFRLPMPDGTSWAYTPRQMSDLAALGYDYDDVSAPTAMPQMVARLRRFGMTVAAADARARSTAMRGRKTVELLGANNQSLRLVGNQAVASVALDPAVQRKFSASLRGVAAAAPTAPDRVFLNLENVRGLQDATAFNVYINVPEGEDPAKYPDHLAGSIALFGVRKATVTDGQHAGDGLTFDWRSPASSTGCISQGHSMPTSCTSSWSRDRCRRRRKSASAESASFAKAPDEAARWAASPGSPAADCASSCPRQRAWLPGRRWSLAAASWPRPSCAHRVCFGPRRRPRSTFCWR
jgi:hypothetical protein